jgi:tripartite ATP-independent transporter DctP family solute receptor
MSRWLGVLFLASAIILNALGAQASQTIILGHNSPPGGPHATGAKAFAEDLERRLPGRFVIDEKGGVTFGAEPDLWDAVKLGTIQMALITSISLSPDVPILGVLDVPFLFRDAAHAQKVLDGPIGQLFSERLNKCGVVVLAWGELGFRHLSTSDRRVVGPADVAGLRVRIVPNEIYRQTFIALGAVPVEMYLPKLYTALRQGIVDGEENPLLVFQANHLDDVQRHVSLTAHVYNPLIFVINADFFNGLTRPEQEAVREAAKAGAAMTRTHVAANEAGALQAFRAKGLDVVETVDRAAFERAVAPLEPSFEQKFGAALLRRIRDTR